MRFNFNYCTVFYGFLFCISSQAQPAQQPDSTISKNEKIISVQSYPLNTVSREFDSQWQGIIAASDGNVYFANSTHSYKHGAGVFKFYPKQKKLEVLADDISKVIGEDITKTPPQGKIHSPFVEHNGWIYFTTHISTYWKKAIDSYTGAHVLGYELATGKFRDFGIVKDRYTIYSAIEVDPVRNLLYVFLLPFAEADKKIDGPHLYSIDIKSGEKKDLGLVESKTGERQHGSLWFFIHNSGDVWFSVWNEKGVLHKYSPLTQKIENFANVLPAPKLAPDGRPAPVTQWKNSITWMRPLPGNNQALYSQGYYGGGDERLWLFDPSKPLKEGEAFKPLAYTGTNFLSVAIGGNRVYFIQKKDIDNARDYDTETEMEKDPDVVGYYEDLHLRSVSWSGKDSGQVVDHGLIVDQDGRKARMIESLAADKNGNVYIAGSWYLKKGELGTLKHKYGKIKHGELVEKKRTQLFAVAQLDINK